jgi:hypothetical protein
MRSIAMHMKFQPTAPAEPVGVRMQFQPVEKAVIETNDDGTGITISDVKPGESVSIAADADGNVAEAVVTDADGNAETLALPEPGGRVESASSKPADDAADAADTAA